MIIKVYMRGGDRTNLSLIKEAASFFFSDLYTKKQQEKLNIAVRLSVLPEDIMGEQDTLSKFNHKIRLDKHAALDDMLTTLAHETIHCKQYDSGKLKELTNHIRWKNKKIPIDLAQRVYYTTPWESEAFIKESKMVARFWLKKMRDAHAENLEMLELEKAKEKEEIYEP